MGHKYGLVWCAKCGQKIEIIYIYPDGVRLLKCDHMIPDPRDDAKN